MYCRELESIVELERLELEVAIRGEMDLPEEYPYFVEWKEKVSKTAGL
jgi:hypothetical protein